MWWWLTAAISSDMSIAKPDFDPGEEVTFDIPDYGSGRGHIAAYYLHSDGTKLYAVAPNNPRLKENYSYVCVIATAKQLISTPF